MLEQVRIYDINQQNGQSVGKAMYQHQGPVLDVCWNKVCDSEREYPCLLRSSIPGTDIGREQGYLGRCR